MAEHTPGPWHLERQIAEAEFSAIGEPIAVIGGEATGERIEFLVGRRCDFGPHGDEQTAANARLIAAAPDLLEACEACIPLISANCLAGDLLRAAIAKAKSP